MIPLHLPSHWSIGHGVASPADLVAWAEEHGVGSLALTDLENLSGWVEFRERCRSRGIRPIPGVELRAGFVSRPRPDASLPGGRRAGRVVLLARDTDGYRGLCRIVSRRRCRDPAAATPSPVPDILRQPEGLVAMSDDAAVIEALASGGFPADSLRLLLVRPRVSAAAEARVRRVSRERGVPLVADLDPVLVDPSDRTIRLLLSAIHRRRTVRDLAGRPISTRRLLPPRVVERLFADVPEALDETRRLAESCQGGLLPGPVRFPAPDLPTGESPFERLDHFAKEALAGARAEGRCRGERYEARLERELGLLRRLDLVDCFLAVREISALARSRGIEVMARGSAVGSLLAHLLGISPVDPVEEGLLFERFLNDRRRDPPDIDLDLPASRRDEVLDRVLRRWGTRSAMVAAHVRFRRRSAWRDGLGAMGAPPAEIDRVLRRLPREGDGPEPDAAELVDSLSRPFREALPELDRLVGAPRHVSVHPGGVVLTDRPVSDLAPLEIAPKGVPVTQYDGRSLDAIGWMKIDLLGNKALDELRRGIELVAERRAVDSIARRLAERGLDAVPAEDPLALALLDRGDTVGCSQIESPATRSMLRGRPIEELADLTAALGAVRPGPAGAEGGPLFEEEVMRDLAEAGRCSLAEADALRAAIVAAGEVPERLDKLGEAFAGAAGRRGAEREDAIRAWESARRFAAYAFSRAHASSYSLLAYRSAWLRARYPVEFGCAVLDHHGGTYPKRTIAAEILRWGVEVRAPSVVRSELGSRPECRAGEEKAAARAGLGHLRFVRGRSKREILRNRRTHGPYPSLDQLLERVPLATDEVEALVLSGACDELPPLSPEGYPFVHEAVLARLKEGSSAGCRTRGRWRKARPEVDDGRVERYRSLVRIRNELRFLGMHLHRHPVAVLREDASANGCRSVREVVAMDPGRKTRLAGLIAVSRRVPTRGGWIRFVTFEDETGLVEAVLRPERERRLGPRLSTGGPYLVEGIVRSRRSSPVFEVVECIPFFARPLRGPLGCSPVPGSAPVG